MIRNHFKNMFRHPALQCFMIVLLIAASFKGWILPSVDYGGIGHLRQANTHYLDKAFQQSITTFGILSTLKVGLAVVEGTEVGVGVNVEVGDAVQAAYDYVDIAWRVVLLSSSVLLGTQYLLHLAALADDWLLASALVFSLLAIILKIKLSSGHALRRMIREIVISLYTLTIACYLILPLAVSSGRIMSERITAGGIQESEFSLSRLKETLFPEQAAENPASLWNKMGQWKDRIQKIGSILSRQTSQLVVWIVQLIAGYVFDCLIFPLLLFSIYYWLIRRMLRAVYAG